MATQPKEADRFEDEETAEAAAERLTERAGMLIGRLERDALEQVRLKQTIERRWMEDLRNYYGRYDDVADKDMADDGRSRAFVKLTRHKTNSWAARLADLLFPTDERNWGIKPTPLPALASAAKEAIEHAKASVEGANEAAAAGNDPAALVMKQQADAYAASAKQTAEEITEAKKRCELMERTIEDQLKEAKYEAQCRDVIEDGCRLGTGILKGPLTANRLRTEWRANTALGGTWQLAEVPDPMPEFKRVDPWHFFPDMSARTIAEAEFTFERHLPTKRDLRRMAKKLGFNKKAVGRLIAGGAPQYSDDAMHVAELRQMVGEGEAIKDRYVMWEYHGPLEGDEISLLLRVSGNEEEAQRAEAEADPLDETRVIVYFIGNEVLKIAPEYPLDSGESLYSVFNYEKGETSIFGTGVPHAMADSQGAVNAAWRMMLDNSALSVGPQIVIDKDQIQPQTRGDWGLKPLKVWLRSSTATAAVNPPFEVHNIPNNQQQLGGIIELGKMFVDEETSMPTIAQGEQGAASQTMGGMSILINSANVVFRRVVKSFDDDLTTPTLRRAYDWNMQFNADKSIKGDMQVDARGTSVLLVREIQSVNLLNIVTNWSVHQVLAPHLKVREAMAKALQTMMITPDDVLYSPEEFQANQEKAAALAAQQPQPPSPEEFRVQLAQIQDESRRYVADQQKEIELIKLAQTKEITLEELRTKLGIKDMELQSKERVKAIEVAVEDKRAAEARADGQQATEATGQGVG